MEMERSRFTGYRRIVARGRHITLTVMTLLLTFRRAGAGEVGPIRLMAARG